MKKSLLTILATIVSIYAAQSQDLPKIFQTQKGIAIEGYDPVSFFQSIQPILGNERFQIKWSGASWYFSTKKNMEIFESDPETYIPQYGGYCAWGMKENYKAPTDPKNAWIIHENKLYLNYNPAVQEGWLPEKTANIQLADDNWNRFSHDEK